MTRDPFEGWVTIRTRVYDSSTIANIVWNGNISPSGGGSPRPAVSFINRMIVDDSYEISPTHFYDFGDSAYHTVRLLLNDNTNLEGMQLWANNYCINYVRFPETIVSLQQYAFRGLGASQTVNMIWRNPIPPVALGDISLGAIMAKIYVPDNSVQAYKEAPYWSALASKIYPISQYSGIYI